MGIASTYDAFFEHAAGRTPYEYQRQLGEMQRPLSVVELPTGSGKTQALIVAWLHQRLVSQAAPRRLVYALPMRSLVEQTRAVAEEIRSRVGLSDEDLAVHTLMGGEASKDWRERPEQNQILVGTIDMLLSRALNRGYGESRFQWPVAFGLLNADCRWVFDEVQLMGPARATSAQLDGLRLGLGTAAPCETVWVSATVDRKALQTVDHPQVGNVMTLPAADRTGPLAKRLTARKVLIREDLSDQAPAQFPRAVAEALAEHHQPGSRSIVVLNTVATAQAVAAALRSQWADGSGRPEIVLLHSRFRPPDRLAHMEEALAAVGARGRIVVSTQVIEAGVDTSARLLATETAPFSSIVQRLGRCNREGEDDDATVLWLDRGEPSPRTAPPYDSNDLTATHCALASLEGESLSPNRLSDLRVAERRVDTAILRRRDLIDLFDTSPDLSGMDVDVARFIRDDDERNLSVFFREIDQRDEESARTQPNPEREELVDIPIGELRDRAAWVLDHVEGAWRGERAQAVRPGQTVMLAAAEGGYDAVVGWDAKSKTPVEPLGLTSPQRAEGIGDDPASTAQRRWVELSEHLAEAYREAQALAATLDPPGLPAGASDALVTAAALHDIGKAHWSFQQMLRSSAPENERPELEEALWAKSQYPGGRHPRRYFRHELASALALRQIDGQAPLESDSLVAYLVAAHHGRVRVSIRPAPDERRPEGTSSGGRFAMGVAQGDEVPGVSTPLGQLPTTVLDLGCMELGDSDSWTAAACRLRDAAELGLFRIAYLEALIRIADWRASD